ncbi:MAG: hypothetical protein WBW99_14600 [Pseudolabrys sp.]
MRLMRPLADQGHVTDRRRVDIRHRHNGEDWDEVVTHLVPHTKARLFPAYGEGIREGIDVSLGSDWCSNDLWKFMRAAIEIPRVQAGNVGLVSGYDALRMSG